MESVTDAPGWRRRAWAAVVGGCLVGVIGGALGEIGLDDRPLAPSVWGASVGCAVGAIAGAVSPTRMLGARRRPAAAGGDPGQDVRETRYWRFGMPVFAAVMVMLGLVQILTGRWFTGILLGFSATSSFLLPEMRYQRRLKRGEDPGPPLPVRRFVVGGRTFGPGPVLGGGLVFALVAGLLVGALLGG